MRKLITILLLVILSSGAYAQQKQQKLKFYQKILYEIFYQKPLRRQIKKSFKDGENINLSDFISNMEGETPVKIKALEQTPYSMYLFLGFWYDCYKNNSEKASIYFGVAYEYVHGNAIAKPDSFLALKIIKYYNRFNPCNSTKEIKLLDDLSQFAKEKNEQEIERLEKTNTNDINSSDILGEKLSKLFLEKKKLVYEIDSLKELVKNKKITITGLTTENYNKALQEAVLFKEKGLILPGTITKNLHGGAKLIAKDDISIAPLSPDIVESGFKLGAFCTNEIKTSTEEIIKAIFKIIDFEKKYGLVPLDYQDRVTITLKLTGKADGFRISKTNGVSNMKYKEHKQISGTYVSNWEGKWKNKKKSKIFSYGTAINDDDLAFLRCDCSFEQAKLVLREFSFPVNNLKVEYTANVFNNKGGGYRGVDISIEINNLFAYNLEKIEIAQSNLKNIKDNITRKEIEKKAIDKRIKTNNEKIEGRNNKIAAHVKSILENRNKKRTKK